MIAQSKWWNNDVYDDVINLIITTISCKSCRDSFLFGDPSCLLFYCTMPCSIAYYDVTHDVI